ncbi:MAG: NfeD family protein [Alphaproteobacteria bacterium]
MIEQIFDYTWGWIVAGMILAGLEILVPGVFLLWIGLGAMTVGLVLSLFPELPPAWQALIFAISMLSSLGFGVWIQRRSGVSADAGRLNREMEQMIGQKYVAISPFIAGRGRIKVQDSSYAAVGEDTIGSGDVVEVVAIIDGRPQVVKAASP